MYKLLPKLLILFLCTGCAAAGVPLPGFSPSFSVQQQQVQSVTSVQLAADNFRIIKTNVEGSDWGFNLLGLIPIVAPSYVKAMEKLYQAGAVTPGRPQAVVNIVQQHSGPYLILFSIPKITFRADIVEFIPAPPGVKPPALGGLAQ